MTQVAEEGASDLHIAVGRHPVLRVSGQLVPLTKKLILTQADTAGLVEAMMGKEWFQEFLQNKEKEFLAKEKAYNEVVQQNEEMEKEIKEKIRRRTQARNYADAQV